MATKRLGVTDAVSVAPATAADVSRSTELESVLRRDYHLFESDADALSRERILGTLHALANECVKKVTAGLGMGSEMVYVSFSWVSGRRHRHCWRGAGMQPTAAPVKKCRKFGAESTRRLKLVNSHVSSRSFRIHGKASLSRLCGRALAPFSRRIPWVRSASYPHPNRVAKPGAAGDIFACCRLGS